MRIVIALGWQRPAEAGRADDRRRISGRTSGSAAQALARVAREHELVISHGNGPQVGLLALQGEAYKDVEAYPLDVLGAETQGMIGYLIEQELGNLLPVERPARDDPDDGRGRPGRPGLHRPDEVRRAGLRRGRRPSALAAEKGWVVKADGEYWRRVVPSPRPKRIFEIRPMRWLLEQGAVVICAGGGGIPTMYAAATGPLPRRRRGGDRQGPREQPAGPRARRGPVRDGDRRRRRVHATGARPTQARIERATPDELAGDGLARRLDGPKVEAAVEFVEATGKRAAIGSLERHRRDWSKGAAARRSCRDQ